MKLSSRRRSGCLSSVKRGWIPNSKSLLLCVTVDVEFVKDLMERVRLDTNDALFVSDGSASLVLNGIMSCTFDETKNSSSTSSMQLMGHSKGCDSHDSISELETVNSELEQLMADEFRVSFEDTLWSLRHSCEHFRWSNMLCSDGVVELVVLAAVMPAPWLFAGIGIAKGSVELSSKSIVDT